MILGRITGKITTTHFNFLVEKETRKFEFVQVLHKVYDYVLCQVVEIERTDKDLARCIVIGYKDERGRIRPIRIPFEQQAEVLKAEASFIKSIIQLEDKGALLGTLEGKDIKVELDLKKLLTKHVCILAKSGSGKSYATGVLIEEIIDKKVPILIIDPHGEYNSLKYKNKEDEKLLAQFGLSPKAYTEVQEFGDPNLSSQVRPLKLNDSLTAMEMIQLFPGKLSNTQMGILYSAIKHLDKINFTNVILSLEGEESSSKWTLINNLEYLKNMDIFTESYISYNEFVQPGKATIINLKGISPDVQEIIVYKLLKDLFELRKKEKIPPFFTIIEEAHSFAPERSFGEAKCSKILRTIASEGRKFGLGICVVSQRPARVDKSVISQCTTQIILKVTNPNDLKAISHSIEGITAESMEEIKNLPIGTALVTGIVDLPLFVMVRPRKSKHGGEAAEMLEIDDENFFEKVEEFEAQEVLPVVQPKISIKDIKLMSDRPIKDIMVSLVPGYLFLCHDNNEFNLLVEMINGDIVTNLDAFHTKALPDLQELSPIEIKALEIAFSLKEFSMEDMIKQGLPLDAKKIIPELIAKGFLKKNDAGFALGDRYILSQLSRHACYDKIKFLQLHYHAKLEPRANLDKVREKLSRFTKINDARECYIARYEPEYA